MKALLLSLLAVATVLIATPNSVAPASAQLRVETPVGGVRVGPSHRRERDYDRRRHRDRDYDRRSHRDRCTTTIIRRSDGSRTRIRRCR